MRIPRRVQLEVYAFDTLTIAHGQRAAIFADRQESTVDDSGMPERELLRFLWSEPRRRALVCRHLGLPEDPHSKFDVTYPFVSGSDKPGDIDVLLAPKGAPHHAVVLEAKRVRVRAGDESGQRVSRLDALGRCADQVSGLCKLRFHQTLLVLMAVVHDLSAPEYGFLFRGLHNRTFSKVIGTLNDLPLPEDAGILYVEVAQPVQAPLHTAGFVAVSLLRAPGRLQQSGDLTSRVDRFLEQPG